MNQPFIRYKNIGRSCFHFVTMHPFISRQKDGWTDICSSQYRGCRLHLKPPAVVESHIQDPTVSKLHRPNVSFIYKQSIHGITVTTLLNFAQPVVPF